LRTKIKVQGVVQGVGYRFFVIRKARDYRIFGYVRNLPDGNVEIVAEGEKGLLMDFIEDLRIGPEAATVTAVNVEWFDRPREFEDFEIKH
jgi:acylphosphatase